MFDFDKVIDRRNTNSLKFDFAREHQMDEDAIPMWVADMDFQTAPAILERLKQRIDHGIFGYTEGKDDYFRAVENWYERHFGWKVQKDWLVKTPGVVFALAMAVRAFTKEGDGVLIQRPVYYPFSWTILRNGRKLVNSPLKLIGDHYEMDFADLEEKIVREHVKLFLLCSPHNPVGRVWKEWELRKVGEICRKHGVLIVSDEIHSDFVWGENRHRVFASLAPEYEEMTIVCTAPSKTFNLAGLQISNIFIPDPGLRKRFRDEIAAAGYDEVNTIGLLACQAAYESGEEWLTEVKQYIWENFCFLRDYLAREIPSVRSLTPEGTYLVWLDLRKLQLTDREQRELIERKAHLWLDGGSMFGSEGEGFERMNIACPRATLERALRQLKNAF